MKSKGVRIQAFFLMVLITILITGCTAPKKVSEASVEAKKTVDIDTSGDAVKIGILHSLSGTMAISEVSVHDAELLAIHEINQKGGVLGKKLEPVVEDGASDWPTYAEKMRKLLQQDKAAAVFGGWTSASRKAMLPVVEQNNGLLFYPVQYEGMESSPNMFYTGATTNQQIVPAVDWLLKNKGKTFFLIGSDYVFPRTANKIIKAQVKAAGGEIAGEEYTPLGHTNYSTLVSKIKDKQPDVIFNTLNGDSNVAFFKQLKDAGISADDMPVMSASVAEEEIRGIGPDVLKGHYAVWNYFQTTNTSENQTFVKNYKKMNGDSRVTSDPIEAGYNAVYLWAAAVETAKSFNIDKVKKAADGIAFKAPGGTVKIDGDTQHLYKTVRIGQITGDGQFKEVWNSGEPVKPDPYLKTYGWAKGLSQ
ncbi:urea ABC transporter substrate-binding protein [Bacillus mojavensis]|uniref:urea ABC transporter substrate-binding protein n=1 Tax=Bacillus mojavensis TaxID=72360 RepID=UPI002DBFDB82|nr:urea ABC transporter substrate-binding protein [Bacillus mojavensis]MEC1687873.1 urea ABC transporter substrate-binding protein [Bacillus mojavensis]